MNFIRRNKSSLNQGSKGHFPCHKCLLETKGCTSTGFNSLSKEKLESHRTDDTSSDRVHLTFYQLQLTALKGFILKNEKSVAIKPERTTRLSAQAWKVERPRCLHGCRGSNLPRVTRGKRRSDGIPRTAGWAHLQGGCPRSRRGGRDAAAARQPAPVRHATAGPAFPWLTLTPAGAARRGTHSTLRAGAAGPARPATPLSACARKWVSLLRPARQGAAA